MTVSLQMVDRYNLIKGIAQVCKGYTYNAVQGVWLRQTGMGSNCLQEAIEYRSPTEKNKNKMLLYFIMTPLNICVLISFLASVNQRPSQV